MQSNFKCVLDFILFSDTDEAIIPLFMQFEIHFIAGIGGSFFSLFLKINQLKKLFKS